MSFCHLLLFVLAANKPDRPLLFGFWRRHQLQDGIKHLFELHARVACKGIVLQRYGGGFCFECVELFGQIVMTDGQLAHAHEGAHDLDVNGDSMRAVQYRRQQCIRMVVYS